MYLVAVEALGPAHLAWILGCVTRFSQVLEAWAEIPKIEQEFRACVGVSLVVS
jgi:hypothetical protein